MIASAKNYTKKQTNKQTNKWRDRTLGQMVKTKLHRQNQTKKHTHTPSQKEKKKETGGKTEIETVGENKFYKSGKIVVV